MEANEKLKHAREFLSQTIAEVLKSWPELHRRVFIQVHYEGKSARSISNSLGLELADVSHILRICERKLLVSLRAFRSLSPETAPKSAVGSSTCFHN
jgi:DNA-directed RNA polymerase specialized sigma24 family protein